MEVLRCFIYTSEDILELLRVLIRLQDPGEKALFLQLLEFIHSFIESSMSHFSSSMDSGYRRSYPKKRPQVGWIPWGRSFASGRPLLTLSSRSPMKPRSSAIVSLLSITVCKSIRPTIIIHGILTLAISERALKMAKGVWNGVPSRKPSIFLETSLKPCHAFFAVSWALARSGR